MNELSLFTGAGGGVLGTMLCGHTPIGYVEWNDYCQQVIAARIRDGIFPEAPIFTDVREFVQSGAAEQYRGFAELVTAGFPCQPFSVAGKQLADADDRDMWPATAEVIRIVQPRSVLLENVTGLISCGYLGVVIKDLAQMGFVGRWGVLGASDVGAPHPRKRVWIVAHAERSEHWPEPHGREAGRVGRKQQPVPWDRGWEVALREFRGMDDGLAYGLERTNTIRNGQVPLVAKYAWEILR